MSENILDFENIFPRGSDMDNICPQYMYCTQNRTIGVIPYTREQMKEIVRFRGEWYLAPSFISGRYFDQTSIDLSKEDLSKLLKEVYKKHQNWRYIKVSITEKKLTLRFGVYEESNRYCSPPKEDLDWAKGSFEYLGETHIKEEKPSETTIDSYYLKDTLDTLRGSSSEKIKIGIGTDGVLVLICHEVAIVVAPYKIIKRE